MEFTDNHLIERHGKGCKNCPRNTFSTNECEWNCIPCPFNVTGRKKIELSKTSRKKIILIDRLKYAQHMKVCICIDVYKIYQDDFSNILKFY